MEYISQLCYIVTTPNLRGWKQLNFLFLLALEPGRIVGQPVLWPRLTKKLLFWGCHPHGRRNRTRGLGGNGHWLSRLLLRCGAITSAHMPLTSESSLVSAPTAMGQGYVPPLIGGAASHTATGAENEQRHTTTERTTCLKPCSLASPAGLQEAFPKSFTLGLLY